MHDLVEVLININWYTLSIQIFKSLASLCSRVKYQAPRLKNFFRAQLSMFFQLLIKTKIPTNKKILALSLSDVLFIMLIDVKMPTIVGILTFMSRINFVLS